MRNPTTVPKVILLQNQIQTGNQTFDSHTSGVPSRTHWHIRACVHMSQLKKKV